MILFTHRRDLEKNTRNVVVLRRQSGWYSRVSVLHVPAFHLGRYESAYQGRVLGSLLGFLLGLFYHRTSAGKKLPVLVPPTLYRQLG